MKAHELLYFEDIDPLVQLAHTMHVECDPTLPVDVKESTLYALSVINDIERKERNVWIVRRNDQMIAFGLGRIGQYPFNKLTVASLMYLYVLPEHRKSSAAFEILHTFENWAKLQGAFRIEVGAVRTDVEVADKINRMFTKRGFVRYGDMFYKPVER